MQKRKITEIISEKFDIPLEGLDSVPNAQIIGNSLLNLDGCIAIKKYESDEIIIKSKEHMLYISGTELSMLTFSHGRVSVRGIIHQYRIERVGKYD